MNDVRRDLPYQPALDGLRALAVAGVLAYHSDLGWVPGGHLGVSTFFTLSGFLITMLLLSEWDRTGRIYLRGFWGRRFRRLLPAALTGLVGIAIAAWLFGDAEQLRRLRAEGLAATLYGANWWFIVEERSYGDLFSLPSPVQHYWSLAIEEQFYLVYPILVGAILSLRRGSRRALAISIGALVVLSTLQMVHLYSPHSDPSRVYFGTDTRAAELLVGALLAVRLGRIGPESRVHSSLLRRATGLLWLVLLISCWVLSAQDSTWLYRGGYLAHAVLSAAVIFHALELGPVRSLLSLGLLTSLGKISYGVYLYHWPVFLFLRPPASMVDGWALFCLQTLATIALAAASYRFIEAPLRFGNRWPGPKAVALASGALLVTIGSIVVATQRPPEVTTFEDPTEPYLATHPPGAPDRDHRVRVLVVGDSAALTLAYGLKGWGRSAGTIAIGSTYLASLSGCGLGRGATFLLPRRPMDLQEKRTICEDWAPYWKPVMKVFRPDVAVVLSGWWDVHSRRRPDWSEFQSPGEAEFDEWMLSEYIAAVDFLSDHVTRVIWLTSPCVPNPPEVLARARPNGFRTVLAPSRLRHLNDVLLPRALSKRPEKMSVLDLDTMLCARKDEREEFERINRDRPDGLHFTEPAALRIAERLGPAILHTLSREPGSIHPIP